MNVFYLDVNLELNWYPEREFLFSEENYWKVLDVVSVPKVKGKNIKSKQASKNLYLFVILLL